MWQNLGAIYYYHGTCSIYFSSVQTNQKTEFYFPATSDYQMLGIIKSYANDKLQKHVNDSAKNTSNK